MKLGGMLGVWRSRCFSITKHIYRPDSDTSLGNLPNVQRHGRLEMPFLIDTVVTVCWQESTQVGHLTARLRSENFQLLTLSI